MPRPYTLSLAALVTLGAFVVACSAENTKTKRDPAHPDDSYYLDPPNQEQPIEPSQDESGAFGAPERPAPDGGTPPKDGGGGPTTYCDGPLAAGDLAIVELMITSRAGSGDDGEWVEIQSTRTCTLKLRGVTIDSPRGALDGDTVTIDEDFDLAPYGTFAVASMSTTAQTLGIPGKVFSWSATDALKNDGDTVNVSMGLTTIDSLTYPSFTNLEAGRSIAFPGDCAMSDRYDWNRWSMTFAEFSLGLTGTPNGANSDVACY
jgi:hypothetical protein